MERPPIAPEGPDSEWKERLPAPRKLARVLAAFANGGGGRLWVGVSDTGELVGVADTDQVKRGVRAAADRVEPRPRLEVRAHPSSAGAILEFQVIPDGSGPAAVVDRQGERTVYRRDGERTLPVPRAEARRLERGHRRIQLRAPDRKLLEILAKGRRPTLPELARAAFLGQRATRRRLVELLSAGLVQEVEGRRYALTPQGHRRR